MVTSFRTQSSAIGELWNLHISSIEVSETESLAMRVWAVVGSLKEHLCREDRRRVEGAPPCAAPSRAAIDRQYTFQFSTGQKAVTSGDERAFLEWFPYLREIGRHAASHIVDAVTRGGFMAAGLAKVVDNAIIGCMQRDDESSVPARSSEDLEPDRSARL